MFLASLQFVVGGVVLSDYLVAQSKLNWTGLRQHHFSVNLSFPKLSISGCCLNTSAKSHINTLGKIMQTYNIMYHADLPVPYWWFLEQQIGNKSLKNCSQYTVPGTGNREQLEYSPVPYKSFPEHCSGNRRGAPDLHVKILPQPHKWETFPFSEKNAYPSEQIRDI